MDVNPEAVAVAASRLKPENLTVICPNGKGAARLLTEDAEGRFEMGGLEITHPAFPARATPADNLESWEIGQIREGVFYAEQVFRRSFRYPELVRSLKMDPKSVTAVATTDAAGARRIWQRRPE